MDKALKKAVQKAYEKAAATFDPETATFSELAWGNVPDGRNEVIKELLATMTADEINLVIGTVIAAYRAAGGLTDVERGRQIVQDIEAYRRAGGK